MNGLLPERRRAVGLSRAVLFGRDVAGGLARPGRVSANGHCRLMRAADGWIALNLARPEDRDVLPALVADGQGLDRTIAAMPASTFRDRATELQLPVALVGEASPFGLAALRSPRPPPRRVLDLSALWAGPLCAVLLQRAGADVLRIDSVGRPDPTAHLSPQLNERLNGGKRQMALDLRERADRCRLLAEVEHCDLLITSARSSALARLGLTPARVEGLSWVAITAHGFVGEEQHRVGFGDDCAAAGGLVTWRGGRPRFRGDALADPLTGLEAALTVLAGARGLIDIAMARVAAAYAQAARCA